MNYEIKIREEGIESSLFFDLKGSKEEIEQFHQAIISELYTSQLHARIKNSKLDAALLESSN